MFFLFTWEFFLLLLFFFLFLLFFFSFTSFCFCFVFSKSKPLLLSCYSSLLLFSLQSCRFAKSATNRKRNDTSHRRLLGLRVSLCVVSVCKIEYDDYSRREQPATTNDMFAHSIGCRRRRCCYYSYVCKTKTHTRWLAQSLASSPSLWLQRELSSFTGFATHKPGCRRRLGC